MTAYIVVAALLTALALIDAAFPRSSRDWGLVATAIVIVFGAFRYQTGYDWLAYETFFDESVDLETALYVGLPQRDIPMEPLYEFLNMTIKSVGGESTLLFVLDWHLQYFCHLCRDPPHLQLAMLDVGRLFRPAVSHCPDVDP